MADMLGKLFVGVGLLLAVVGGFVSFNYLGLLVMLLGLMYGFVSVDKDFQEFVVAGLGLSLGVGVLALFSSVSDVFSGYLGVIFGNVVTLFSAAVLAVAVKMLYGYMMK